VARRNLNRSANDAPELLPDPEAVDKLSVFFETLGSDHSAAVALYTVDPQNRLRRSFLLTLPDAAALTGPDFMTQVLERFGAGEYYAESRDASTGQILLGQRFEVGPIGKRGAVLPPASTQPAAAPAAPVTSTLPPELGAMLARQTALLEAIATRSAAPSIFQGLNLPEVIGAVTSALAAMRKLAEPAQPAPANPTAHVDLILKGIELARELRDDAAAGSEDGILGAFRELLRSPLLARALDERAPPTPRKRLPAPARPASEAPQVSPNPPAAASALDAIPPAKMRQYLSALVSYAERDSDPALYAELALDNVPEDVLRALVDRADALEGAIALEPAVGSHREWFAQLLTAVRAALVDELEEPPPASKPTNGAAVDAP
jgi:hypothetical protein